MFRIKICGITRVDDALQATVAGADALGLNFYARSPRFLAPGLAAEISRAVRGISTEPAPKLVGVFVNEEPAQLELTRGAVGLDAWQLHGDEPPELVAALLSSRPAGVSVFRAFRCREPDLGTVATYLESCRHIGGLPQAVLLDAYAPDAFGGTGKVVDWHVVRQQRDLLLGLPVILAGGLTPDNVGEAIRTARPAAVDVANGVESSPGKKDPTKVLDFIAAAQEAFREIASTQ